MRIGIDCRMIKATGIGRYTENLVKELANIDSKNQYTLFLKKEDYGLFKVPAKNFKKVLADFHWYSLKEQLNFPAFIERQNLDLMHFPHFNIPIRYKGKFVVTIHDLTLHRHKTVRSSTKSILTYQIKHLAYKIAIKKAVKKSFKILVPTNCTKGDVIKILKVPDKKIVVTYEGGPSSEFLSKKSDNNILKKFNLKRPFILYVGNAYPHKNIENLVNALKYLTPNIHLVLVGKIDEFYKRIKKQVANLKLEKRVIFTDFVKDGELVSLYQNASVYAFPSLNEGFGLPALEAMAFGLPVVSSGSSCFPEVLGNASLFFDPKKPKEIASKISEVIKDNALDLSLKNRGFEKVKEYSWRKMAKETLDVYQGVLHG